MLNYKSILDGCWCVNGESCRVSEGVSEAGKSDYW